VCLERKDLSPKKKKTVANIKGNNFKESPFTYGCWRIPEGEKVVLRCNRLGVPVGTTGLKFRRLSAKLIIRTGKLCDFHTRLEEGTNTTKTRYHGCSYGRVHVLRFFYFFIFNFFFKILLCNHC